MSLLTTASLVITPNAGDEGTLYSVIPSDGSGDMSVVRATTATRVNSAGLVELVPYNLVEYSSDLSNAYWTKRGFTQLATNAIAPDGSATAYKIQENNTDANPGVVVVNNATPSGVATFFVWLKSDANTSFALSTNGGVQGTTINVTTAWQLFSITQTDTPYNGPHIGGFSSIAQNSGIVLYVWHPQLNAGSAMLPYQPTTTRLNIPRLDYSNGTCPSLLVEPQRTNLVTNSSAFSNWLNAGGTVTNNTTTAPDGTMTADTLTGLRYQVGFGTNVYTFSCYAKANGGSGNFYIRVDAPATFQTLFDLINGVIDSVPIGYTATIKDVGNGWFRCTMTTPNITLVNAVIASSDYGANSTYIWGAQLEAGSYPTSYIPTTSASVTRNADVVSKTGISSLIGQTEGALFIDTYIDNIEARTLNVLSYLKGTVVDKYITISNTGGVAFVDFPSINISSPSFGLTNGRHKFAIAYKTNDFAFYIDGVQVGTASSGVPSACSEFGYSYYASGYDFPLGVNATALWKTRLTNTQLAQLTTI